VLDLVKRFAVSFAASLLAYGVLSLALAAYLVGAFQQTVDTNSASQNGRMDGIQQHLTSIQSQLNGFSDSLLSVESGVSELKTVQSDFTSKGLYRIDALAASTDFLLTQVDRMLSRVEPSPIMNLGLLGESPLLLNTGSSGRLVATFETLQEATLIVSTEPSSELIPYRYLFELTLLSRDAENIYRSEMSSRSSIVVDGFSPMRLPIAPAGPGSYVIVVESIPDFSFSLGSIPLEQKN